jgi:hypothetical protein
MNALAVAVQGLGFDAAFVALQGLLAFVAIEVQKYEAAGGGSPVNRRTRRSQAAPLWLPKLAVEDEEAMLLVGLL